MGKNIHQTLEIYRNNLVASALRGIGLISDGDFDYSFRDGGIINNSDYFINDLDRPSRVILPSGKSILTNEEKQAVAYAISDLRKMGRRIRHVEAKAFPIVSFLSSKPIFDSDELMELSENEEAYFKCLREIRNSRGLRKHA